MAILTQSEQHEIKVTHTLQGFGIGFRALDRTQFRRNVVNLVGRHRHVIEPGFARHQAVAVLVIDRQTTVVIMVDVPFAPVGFGMSQQFIHLLGGGAASQHDGKTAARGNRFPRCIEDALEGGLVDGILTVERMPAGNLLIAAGDLA